MTGTACSIAECGEQLAWLSALYVRPPSGSFSFCTPFIDEYNVSPVKNDHLSQKPRYEGHCKMNFHVEVEPAKESGIYHCKPLAARPLVVKGFPILNRQVPCAGLEVSFSNLLAISEAPSIVLDQGGVLILGSQNVMVLYKIIGEFCIWQCIEYQELGILPISSPNPAFLGDLTACRHIISKRHPTSVDVF